MGSPRDSFTLLPIPSPPGRAQPGRVPPSGLAPASAPVPPLVAPVWPSAPRPSAPRPAPSAARPSAPCPQASCPTPRPSVEVRIFSLEAQLQQLAAQCEALHTARLESVDQLAAIRRELRSTIETLCRVVDELTPIKLLGERAVLAAESGATMLSDIHARCPVCAESPCAPEDAALVLSDADVLPDADVIDAPAPLDDEPLTVTGPRETPREAPRETPREPSRKPRGTS